MADPSFLSERASFYYVHDAYNSGVPGIICCIRSNRKTTKLRSIDFCDDSLLSFQQ